MTKPKTRITTPKRGFFITFEGIDGSGKTTQAELLSTWARDTMGLSVVRTREPGGTAAGREMRTLLLDQDRPPLTKRAEMLLMAADRAQHVDEVIVPALAAGKLVISDRYLDSTLAYQGYANGGDLKAIESVVRYACNNVLPDLTILLDCPVQIGLQRRMEAKGEVNRIDSRSMEYHTSVRVGYMRIATVEPRITTVDSRHSIGDIAAAVRAAVEPHLCRMRDTGTLVLERQLAVA